MSGAIVLNKVAIEEIPTPRAQVLGLNAGVMRGVFQTEASASSEVIGVFLSVNNIDDVGAANNFVGARLGVFVPLDCDQTIHLNADAVNVYLMAMQSGATNPSPTAGYIGAANNLESSQAAVNVTNIMQRLDGWGAGVRRLRMQVSKTWGSGRYALVRVEGYR